MSASRYNSAKFLKNRVRQTKSLLSGRLKVNQSEISAEIDGLDAINDYDYDN